MLVYFLTKKNIHASFIKNITYVNTLEYKGYNA